MKTIRNSIRLAVLSFLVAGIFICAERTGAATLYVATNGNDSWNGDSSTPNASRTDGPLASLNGARLRIEKLRSIQGLKEPVKVFIENGDYTVDRPVDFGPEDSGHIAYVAANGAHPVFNGGRLIRGWKRAGNGLWTAQIPEVRRGAWYFEQLWVNGRRAERARTPADSYSYTAGKEPFGVDPVTGKAGDLSARAFRAYPKDIRLIKDLKGQELNDVTLVALHSWEVSRLRIASVDPKTNVVVTTGPAAWAFMQWTPSQRYYFENVGAALTKPGQWFLTRKGELRYLPLPGEDMAKAQVIAPVCPQFLRFNGTEEHPVSDLRFENLSFRYGQHILEPQGHSDGQAAFNVPAVVMADYARDISFYNCEIGHVGLYGVWFRRGCINCGIIQCYLHDLGAGGVRIGQGWDNENPTTTDQTSNIRVDNCIIRSGGHIFFGAVGVWIGNSGRNMVSHNDIGDFRYTGVSVGWRWGYADSLAKDNLIADNLIHNLGWGVLSDMGGIYTLGPSDGTIISGNVIHDVYSYDFSGRGGWGIYNDEGTTHITVRNNLVYRTKTGGYHQHYGRENLIENNIFAYSMDGQLQRSRVEDFVPFTFRNNIVYWNGGKLLTGIWSDPNMRMDHNIYWDTAREPVTFQGMDLAAWQAAGRDVGSVIADPQFKDPEHGDFRIPANSPAFAVGFVPFDYSHAGVYDNGYKGWETLAKSPTYPPVIFTPPPPPAPPLAFHLTFNSMPVGALSPFAQTNVEGRGDSIAVTDDTSYTGAHSLKVTDAPGLANDFDPHLVFNPSHVSGVSTFRFAMRAEAGVRMYQEWRDWRTEPYRAGPSFWIQDGKLTVNGSTLMVIPVGQWVVYEVKADIGPNSSGAWDLAVTLPGAQPQRFEKLRNVNGKLEALTWLGFSSMATDRTVFYLDDLYLTNTNL